MSVSRETLERLDILVGLIARWNPAINLVADPSYAVVWERHVEDSLQLLPLLPPAMSPWFDLGSGGGFPGLVLSIASGAAVTLVESDRRKAEFLREAVRRTGAKASVVQARVEHADLPIAALVTARALAPLSRLLDLAEPLLGPHTVCLFPKGRQAAQEIADARTVWRFDLAQTPSRLDGGGTLLALRGIARG